MSAYRIECDVDGRLDWNVVNNTTILLGHPEDSDVQFTLVFRSRQLLANFAHDINRMVGLTDNYNLFHKETDEDVAPPETPSPSVIDLTVSPPTNATEDKNERPMLDDLDLSSEIYRMAIETPIKRIIKPSPFSEGTKSNTSPSEQMESQAVWSRF
jgi:hypothetical protein